MTLARVLLGAGALLCVTTTTCLAGDPENGKRLYQSFCENCHGSDGRSVMPGSPDFSRKEGLLQSDMTLFEVIQGGKLAMPGFRGTLDDNELLDVISYLRLL